MIRLPHEGYHQTVFFNPDALDYISFPTHKVEEAETESYDEGLTDGDEIEDTKVIKSAKPRKKGKVT